MISFEPFVTVNWYPNGASVTVLSSPAQLTTLPPTLGNVCVQLGWSTSQTTYVEGNRVNSYLPMALVNCEAMNVSPWYTRISQSARGGSVGSFTPLPATSLNLMPDFLPPPGRVHRLSQRGRREPGDVGRHDRRADASCAEHVRIRSHNRANGRERAARRVHAGARLQIDLPALAPPGHRHPWAGHRRRHSASSERRGRRGSAPAPAAAPWASSGPIFPPEPNPPLGVEVTAREDRRGVERDVVPGLDANLAPRAAAGERVGLDGIARRHHAAIVRLDEDEAAVVRALLRAAVGVNGEDGGGAVIAGAVDEW